MQDVTVQDGYDAQVEYVLNQIQEHMERTGESPSYGYRIDVSGMEDGDCVPVQISTDREFWSLVKCDRRTDFWGQNRTLVATYEWSSRR